MQNKKLIIGINASFARKPNTGIGQVTLNFLRKLSKLKVQSEKSKVKDYKFVLYLEEDLSRNIKLPNGFEKRIFLPWWRRDDLVRKIWWEKYLLPKRAKKDGCDVFLSLYQCPTIIKNAKHVTLVHDIIPSLFPEYLNNSRKKHYQKLAEKAIKAADKILAVSKRTEKDLVRHLEIPPEKISVNYISVDEIYAKKVSEEKNKKVLKKYKLSPGYILAGGGMEVRKNVEGVIRAYKFLIDKKFVDHLPDLIIYGKLQPQLAPLSLDAEELIKELNLTKKVKLLDMVPQENMPALFRNSVFFIYPSHYEGFGMPVLEAMNQGKPVITAKTSSLPEVGLDAVLYCNPDDIYDMAMVMKNVLSNPKLRETLSQRGKERASNFSWEKFTKKVLNVFNNSNK